MISVNLRLILAIPVYLLGALLGLVGVVVELGTLYGMLTLDPRMVVQCLISGAILAIVSAAAFGIGGLINGDTTGAPS